VTDDRQTAPRRAHWLLHAAPLRVLCLICAALVASIASWARAAEDEIEPPPAPLLESSDVALHAKLASALYKAGNFLEAASELNVAYTLQPQPVFLFNIAQAYRRGMRAKAAKVMYQRFLEVAPNHPLSIEARGYMLDMDSALEKILVKSSACDGDSM
jgi:tetratricopeptide (TPR) repeat protein